MALPLIPIIITAGAVAAVSKFIDIARDNDWSYDVYKISELFREGFLLVEIEDTRKRSSLLKKCA